MNDIYTQMRTLGVEISHHESDLFVPVTAETQCVVDKYEHKTNVTTFISNIDGKRWYNIPFAYAPWWEKRGM